MSRKRKKEEKAKTQLKKSKTAPGRHLPKGTNVTKTEFKVTKIVIPGQRGEADQSGPVTSKKLGLKELLAKLSHFSQTVRADGLEGLKELFSSSSGANLCTAQPAAILASLVPLTQDRERKIRRQAVELLSLVLRPLTPPSLVPHHPLLAAHLGCALTHIDPRIQQDGLRLLDTMLDQAPAFVSANWASILPNCLDQISNKKAAEAAGPRVAANLSESQTALQWRLAVLTRLDRMLELVAAQKEEADDEGSRGRQAIICTGKFYPVRDTRPAWLPLSCMQPTNTNTNTSLVSCLELVVPLLLETWVEARAGQKAELPPETGQLLGCCAGLLHRLVSLALRASREESDATVSLLRTKFWPDIQRHLVQPLPYRCAGRDCEQSNALLSWLALMLEPCPDPVMLNTAVAAAAGLVVTSGLRLALAARLLADKGLTEKQWDLLVAALVTTAASESGRQRGAALLLLRDQAGTVARPATQDWLDSLPATVLTPDCSPEELDICLDLAKANNKPLALKFLELLDKSGLIAENGSWCEGELDPGHRTKLSFIREHCRRVKS